MPEAPPPKPGLGSRAYKDAALSAAHAQSLTPEQVESMGYHEIAALTGVTIEANGDSPTSFVYRVIQRYVANHLRRELRAAFWEEIRVHNEAEVQSKPGMEECTLVLLAPGHFEIRDKDGRPVAMRSIF